MKKEVQTSVGESKSWDQQHGEVTSGNICNLEAETAESETAKNKE